MCIFVVVGMEDYRSEIALRLSDSSRSDRDRRALNEFIRTEGIYWDERE